MADHDELVAEMLALEQMGTQERQKLAKKRRMQQLKKWSQREKEWIAKEKQLNRRLANILNEENNGLNLKQYTTYNSNQRTKKRLTTAANTNTTASTPNSKLSSTTQNNNGNRYNNGSNGVAKGNAASKERSKDDKILNSINHNNNNLTSVDGPYANNLTPNGRVHFNVGVMLLEAAARNDYDEVKRLLTLGVSPDSVNHDGLTALHQCCIDASEPIMNLLLEFGANVDARDTERWTPLHAACTCGHLNLVKILVEHGADLLAVNGDGNMPFDICEDEATLDYIESQMIKRGVTQEMIDTTRASNEAQMLNDLERLVASGKGDLNQADENGVTQLHIATANNYLSVVKFLLKHGANVNACDNDQWRPLHGVACWGNEQHIKVAELLVEDGADLNAKTSSDETVFDLCDNVELLERLNQLKDELESKQTNGTDRLRRTQSRTNSRVHSVRRTRVQDKNQISRREAREEAMLRVESSEAVNGSDQQPLQLPDSSQPDLNNLSETDQQSEMPQNKVETTDLDSPLETNLDQASENHSPDQVSSIDQVDSSASGINQPNRSQRQNPNLRAQEMSQEETSGSYNEQGNSGPVAHSENVTKMLVSAPASPRRVNSEMVTPPDTPSKHANNFNESRSMGPRATSIVQVHFSPTNYTLSNLKKHRSEVRMRTAVIGGGGGSSSAVHLDPEPSSALSINGNGTSVEMSHANGWLPSPSGPTLTFNKFHGEPSETIEDRRRNYKCCTII